MPTSSSTPEPEVLPDVDVPAAFESEPASEEPTFRAPKKRRNWTPLWIGLGIFACVAFIALAVWFVKSNGISMPKLPTSQPQPQVGNPTATPNDLGVSPQVFEMLKYERTKATPVPGAGPFVTDAPTVPTLKMQGDAFDWLRDYINQYSKARKGMGKQTSLYEVTDNVVVWIFAVERNGAGQCKVVTEGGTWYNANLESCKGLDLTIKDGGAFIMAELNDSRVDNSSISVEPFYDGSTMGRWGMFLAEGKNLKTIHLTTGLVFVPNDTDYTFEPVTLIK